MPLFAFTLLTPVLASGLLLSPYLLPDGRGDAVALLLAFVIAVVTAAFTQVHDEDLGGGRKVDARTLDAAVEAAVHIRRRSCRGGSPRRGDEEGQ
jgi:hypothetical protein